MPVLLLTARVLCAALFFFQSADSTGSPPLTGHIVQKGKPVVGAKIVYTNTTNGRTYTTTTDKKGDFVFAAIATGIYEIEIFRKDGTRVYHGVRAVTLSPGLVNKMEDQPVPLSPMQRDNELNLDLATVPKAALDPIVAETNVLIDETHNALRAHDWPRARTDLQRLIALQPERWEFYQNLGTIEIYLGHYSEAIPVLEKGTAVVEQTLGAVNPEAAHEQVSGMLMGEGEAHDLLADFEKAVEAYKKAASLTAHPAMPLFLACQGEEHLGHTQAATDLCLRAIAADATQWEFYRALAAIQAETDPAAALATYGRGIEMGHTQLAADPDSGVIKAGLGQMLNAQGNLFAKQKDYPHALADFTEATRYAAYPALPWSNLCVTYFNLQRMPEAVAACDKTIALDPYLEEAYFLKASALLSASPVGREKYVTPPGVREALTRYLELAPNGNHSAAARNMLEQLGPP
jgi:tetratricopeptide (TPR) repeat protein